MLIDASDETRIFDASALSALFEGEPIVYSQFLGDVLRSVDECVRAIAVASETRDLSRVRSRAHELKGVAGNVGAEQLAACSRAVEEAAKRGAIEDVNAALPALIEAHVRCRAAIAALI
jgi:HPt (histidine-containing phosphotransfer) domain-containing protein